MGVTMTWIKSCGSWPQVVEQINLMSLDNRIDSVIVEWTEQNLPRQCFYSEISRAEVSDISHLMDDKLVGYSRFQLCSTQSSRLLRVIAA